MPTDQDIADLCCGIYAYPGEAPIAWDYLSEASGFTGVRFGVKYFNNADVFIFRGTYDSAEWTVDLDFIVSPKVDSRLGQVHDGFLLFMPETWVKAKTLRRPGKKLWAGGHSLGAARADVFCGLAILDGDVPTGRVVFGEPYPGFASFCDLLKPIPWQSSYCNEDEGGHDLVTDSPIPSPPRLPFRRPTPLIHLYQAPALGDNGVARYHHMQLYRSAPGKRTKAC